MKSRSNLIFASVLKAERNRQGLTQEALAFKANISRAYLSMLEMGTSSPSLDMLIAIASGLQLSLSGFAKLIENAIDESSADGN